MLGLLQKLGDLHVFTYTQIEDDFMGGLRCSCGWKIAFPNPTPGVYRQIRTLHLLESLVVKH
jgi:hypothetical protein